MNNGKENKTTERKNNKMETKWEDNRQSKMMWDDRRITERNKNGWTDILNGKRARFGRIFGMEIGDNVRSMSKSLLAGNQEVSSLVLL